MFSEQVFECPRPTSAERWEIDDPAELVDVAIRQVHQRVDIGDTEPVATAPCQHDVVAGTNVSFFDDSEIEPRTVL